MSTWTVEAWRDISRATWVFDATGPTTKMTREIGEEVLFRHVERECGSRPRMSVGDVQVAILDHLDRRPRLGDRQADWTARAADALRSLINRHLRDGREPTSPEIESEDVRLIVEELFR